MTKGKFIRTPEFREKLSKLLKGHIWSKERNEHLSKIKKGITLTKEHKKALSENHWSKKEGYVNPRKGKHCPEIMGEKNPNWNGGKSLERLQARNSLEAKLWKLEVFERDNYTCQSCGASGVYLHAHHLYSFKDYPEYRYLSWNGQTLCKECHYNLHFTLSKKFQKNKRN